MKQNVKNLFAAPDTNEPADIAETGAHAETRRSVSRRDAMRLFTVAGISSATALAGCGGGSGTSASGIAGRATLAITWPAVTTTRLIPVAANSIVIQFLQGTTVVGTQTVARPSTGMSSTVTFASLPAGALTLQATSYPNSDGTGVAQATATSSVTIVAGQNTALGITMASTIASLGITPTSPTATIGGTTQLAMTALDSSGHIVLTSASTVTWASGSTGIATVNSTGLVTGVAAGNATITVTESESGKTATVAVTVSTATSAHAVTPEGEIGPYFTDDSASAYNRSNILSNLDGTNTQAGIPLVLSIYVYDTENGNAAMSGCQVDIWHCNATGLYSNESVENTLGQTWLRGYQVTDANGFVKFTTIFPGWYQGRTTHIHLRVRSKYSQASSTSDGTNTTQVFFPQATEDYIYTHIAPYNTEGVNTTTNVGDHVYTGETHAQTQLVLTGDYTTGYAATAAIYLPITAE